MKNLVWAILLFSCIKPNYVSAQQRIKGWVISSSDSTALAYVNIGVVDKALGTVTDQDGKFDLFIKKEVVRDSIRISMVGFESITLPVSVFIEALAESPFISMKEKVNELSQVIVTNEKLKEKVLGNRAKSRKSLYEATADLLGSEIGVKIKIKKAPTYLKRFKTRLLTKRRDHFKFRLNLYDIKDGLPNENLLTENILIEASSIKDGWIDLDLEPYDIQVEDDFFITLEWVQGNGKRKLRFPASLFGPLLVERETSQAKWNKHTVASIGFRVTVEY